MILFAILILVALVILIAAGVVAADRRQQLQPPTHLPPELPPPQPKLFHKRPPPTQRAHGAAVKNIRLRGRVRKRSDKPDFNRVCTVKGLLMKDCGCSRCRELRKKHGV
jgi:hypothetical protein